MSNTSTAEMLKTESSLIVLEEFNKRPTSFGSSYELNKLPKIFEKYGNLSSDLRNVRDVWRTFKKSWKCNTFLNILTKELPKSSRNFQYKKVGKNVGN